MTTNWLWMAYAFGAHVCQWLLLLGIRRRQAYQVIYELGPESHQHKVKTPSFGGVAILLNLWVGAYLFHLLSPMFVWLLMVFSSFSILGLLDDGLSLCRNNNQGLTSRQKFLAQIVCSLGLLFIFNGFISPLKMSQMVFYTFVMVGASNATNLSDGLDGLLGGLSLLSIAGFAVLFWASGMWDYLPFCMVFCVAIAAFLSVNLHPAQQFMGDTGSLAIGALFAALAIAYGNVWVLVGLGAVYILETLSVMAQVLWYKRTKTRVFLMAPLHHHFELMGLSEKAVVRLFWVVQLLFIGGYLVAMGVWK
ncbi:MAG: phospho-N-acetylmuramoyl-pentapeptide-transferase [bacterium]|nr:phospho-N-acetylmuramoyl-pentapeptide-transferase [bacterium]